MNIAVINSSGKAEKIIKQLLSPWYVCFSTLDKADVVVSYENLRETGKATVIIPSETAGLHKWLEKHDLKAIDTQGKKLKVPATDSLTLTLIPRTQRAFVKSNYPKIVDDEPFVVRIEDNKVLLPVDLIKEYDLKMNEVLNPRVSSMYRFVTGLPIPYTLVPNRLRNFLFNVRKVTDNYSYLDHLDLDALRYILIDAIEKVTGKPLQKKVWNGSRSVCLITHDIETRDGLQKALSFKRLEERYDIPSTWYIPTSRYKLESDIISQLANYGEIGAHGTKHNGKLIRLSTKKIIDRLRESKIRLETIIEQEVFGFRAPLLQHNEKIFQGLRETGYSYDTSIPTWEPKHPSTMGSHGVGTIYPLNLDGMIEIPLTILQDYQMIRVLGINCSQTIENWINIKKVIDTLGGLYSILVHPDYEFATKEGLRVYENLINALTQDHNSNIMVPMKFYNSLRGISNPI